MIQARKYRLKGDRLGRYRLQNTGSRDSYRFQGTSAKDTDFNIYRLSIQSRAWIATCSEMVKVSDFHNSEKVTNHS